MRSVFVKFQSSSLRESVWKLPDLWWRWWMYPSRLRRPITA